MTAETGFSAEHRKREIEAVVPKPKAMRKRLNPETCGDYVGDTPKATLPPKTR